MREETREVIFEDDSLQVINKASGIVSESMAVFAGVERGGLVHRLDKDTSGVMVLAKTPEAYVHLTQQFRERKTHKQYLALVHGTFKESEGLISTPIERNPKLPRKFTIGSDLSRTSVTAWKVLQVLSAKGQVLSLLELTPHTGRTHQLRVHLKSISHPIVSDPIYGWAKKVDADFAWCPRLFLHAEKLSFAHPKTQKMIEFSVGLPVDLNSVLRQLHDSHRKSN